MKKLMFWLMLVGLVAAPALADRAIDETVSASPDGEVSVELIAGTITVIGWDRSEVRVTGTVGDDVEEVEIEADRGSVSIEVELRDDENHKRMQDAGADLQIYVPVGSAVEAEAVSADITVKGVEGEIEVESVSGDVELDGSASEIRAASVSGDIEVVSDRDLREGEFETVSGDIEFHAPLGAGDFSFESVSGDVELYLPGGTSADFDVETFSGRIVNKLGPSADERGDEPGKSLEFTIGGGAARVEVESFSGQVTLRAE